MCRWDECVKLLCWLYISLILFTIFLWICKLYFSVSANYISLFLPTVFLIVQCWSVWSSADEAEVPNCFVAAPWHTSGQAPITSTTQVLGSKIPSFASWGKVAIVSTAQVQLLNYQGTKNFQSFQEQEKGSLAEILQHIYTPLRSTAQHPVRVKAFFLNVTKR